MRQIKCTHHPFPTKMNGTLGLWFVETVRSRKLKEVDKVQTWLLGDFQVCGFLTRKYILFEGNKWFHAHVSLLLLIICVLQKKNGNLGEEYQDENRRLFRWASRRKRTTTAATVASKIKADVIYSSRRETAITGTKAARTISFSSKTIMKMFAESVNRDFNSGNHLSNCKNKAGGPEYFLRSLVTWMVFLDDLFVNVSTSYRLPHIFKVLFPDFLEYNHDLGLLRLYSSYNLQ